MILLYNNQGTFQIVVVNMLISQAPNSKLYFHSMLRIGLQNFFCLAPIKIELTIVKICETSLLTITPNTLKLVLRTNKLSLPSTLGNSFSMYP